MFITFFFYLPTSLAGHSRGVTLPLPRVQSLNRRAFVYDHAAGAAASPSSTCLLHSPPPRPRPRHHHLLWLISETADLRFFIRVPFIVRQYSLCGDREPRVVLTRGEKVVKFFYIYACVYAARECM